MITRSTGQSTAFFFFPHNYQPSGTGIAPILNKNPRVQIQAHHMRKPRASRLPGSFFNISEFLHAVTGGECLQIDLKEIVVA